MKREKWSRVQVDTQVGLRRLTVVTSKRQADTSCSDVIYEGKRIATLSYRGGIEVLNISELMYDTGVVIKMSLKSYFNHLLIYSENTLIMIMPLLAKKVLFSRT